MRHAKGLASIYTDVPTLRPGTVEAYALAFASTGVATVVRLAIDPYVMGAECLPFFPAVMITALIGGRDAGLFCVVLSAAAVTFLQMPPLTLLLFVLLTIFIVILITRMRLAIQREQAAQAIQASKDRLQFTLDMARLGSWQYDPRRQVLTGIGASRRFSVLPPTRCRSRISRSWCIRTTRKGFGRTARHRSIPANRSAHSMSTGFSGETARSAG